MARFFFPSSDGDSFEPDHVGVEFDSVEGARADAVRALAEMARDLLDGGSDSRLLRVRVVDEAGQTVFAARLAYAPDDEA